MQKPFTIIFSKAPKNACIHTDKTAYYHLPGLFEFYELYRIFLPLFREHREYFYDWCEIGSIYGAPADCLWGGGRVGYGDCDPEDVRELMDEYGISARLTFSNSLLCEEHLADKRCNELCRLFEKNGKAENGVIVHSDLLLDYLKKQYPGFYFVSSTTKVLTDFEELVKETDREDSFTRFPSASLRATLAVTVTVSKLSFSRTAIAISPSAILRISLALASVVTIFP